MSILLMVFTDGFYYHSYGYLCLSNSSQVFILWQQGVTSKIIRGEVQITGWI